MGACVWCLQVSAEHCQHNISVRSGLVVSVSAVGRIFTEMGEVAAAVTGSIQVGADRSHRSLRCHGFLAILCL